MLDPSVEVVYLDRDALSNHPALESHYGCGCTVVGLEEVSRRDIGVGVAVVENLHGVNHSSELVEGVVLLVAQPAALVWVF